MCLVAEVAVLLEKEEENIFLTTPVWNVKRVSWGHLIHLSLFLSFVNAFTEVSPVCND